MKYYIRDKQKTYGPAKMEKISLYLANQKFSRETLLSEDGKNWFPVSQNPEIMHTVKNTGGRDLLPAQNTGAKTPPTVTKVDRSASEVKTSEKEKAPVTVKSPADLPGSAGSSGMMKSVGFQTQTSKTSWIILTIAIAVITLIVVCVVWYLCVEFDLLDSLDFDFDLDL